MDKNALERDVRKKYIELQIYKHQLNALIEEKNKIDSRVEELRMTINALEKLEKTKNGEEIWSPLGSNAFVISDIKDSENIMLSIGAGVVVKKNRKSSLEILQSRLDEMNEVNKALEDELHKYNREALRLETEVQKIAERL